MMSMLTGNLGRASLKPPIRQAPPKHVLQGYHFLGVLSFDSPTRPASCLEEQMVLLEELWAGDTAGLSYSLQDPKGPQVLNGPCPN